MQNFLKKYSSPKQKNLLQDSLIDDYIKQLPRTYLDFLKQEGFGLYGDGLIQIINPSDYSYPLSEWLGKENPNYLPIVIDAFGNMYYYRKLSTSSEDVCMIDTTYRTINICTWDLENFFNEYLCNDEIVNLKAFLKCKKKLGVLSDGQIYSYKLVPVLGGDAKSIENKTIGSAKEHISILFQAGA